MYIWQNNVWVQTLKQSDLSYKVIMMDYFLVLFLFVSTEDIIVNVDAENIVGIIRNIVGIIYSKRNQKWLFLSLNTGNSTCKLPHWSKTSDIPMFLETCKVGCDFKLWYKLLVEEGKWLFRLTKHCVKFWNI